MSGTGMPGAPVPQPKPAAPVPQPKVAPNPEPGRPVSGAVAVTELDPAHEAALKRVAEWDWEKEPHDWTTVPTYFTPEAPAPAPKVGGYLGKDGETVPFAGTVDEVRALPALKILKKMGYTSDPPEPPPGTTGTGAALASRNLRATGVQSPPKVTL
jgi:hypothetical protein